MGLVVSLNGYLPPPRNDGLAWSGVQVYEEATLAGPATLIDTQALPTPLDTNPASPQVRNITTSHGTLPNMWYFLVFTDVAGGYSDPSDPLRNTSAEDELPPTPDAIRAQSPLLRKNFPLPPTNAYQPSDLRNLVYQSVSLVQSLTWRLIDPSLGDSSPEGYVSEAVPPWQVPIVFQAVARMAERVSVTTAPAFAEQLATGRLLRGFSAGPYSEQYFSPGEFARRGAQQGRQPMDVESAIDEALWALATEDARDYFVWRATGITPPTGVATAFDYRRANVGYSAGGLGGPFGGRGGPDGF